MPDNLPSINLVTDKKTPFSDKFMDWALTIGRLIVIITEIVAVIVFVYRFSLDDKIVNLHSAIKQQQNIVSVMKNDEDKYRNLQDRLTLASTFSTKAINSEQNIIGIMSLMQNQVKLNNFVLNQGQIKFKADITSVSDLDNLVNSLKNYRNIKSISIDSMENKPSIGLSVDITTVLK